MKKIIGLAVALVVLLGIEFGLPTKVDDITVDNHNINQNEYVKDENGHKHYKTIDVKKKNFLKIVNLNGGLILKEANWAKQIPLKWY